MNFYLDVVNVIIKVFKWMNVLLEKCLSLLWGFRRFSYVFCVVFVNEVFVLVFLIYYCKDVEFFDFWMSSMKDF